MSRAAALPFRASGLVALAVVLLSTNVDVFAQELVPNGDFEQYYGCPDNAAQIDSVVYWFDPTGALEGSPDYYNECSTDQLADVPLNYLSYQQARSGSACVGLVAHYIPWLSEFREYVEVGLLAPLAQDSCYRFSMYVNLARLGNYAIEDIGVYFSDTAIVEVTHDDALPFVPQVTNSTGFITDTLGWTEVSGLYQAHGGENFITIGNFQNDSTTSLMYVDSTLNFNIIYFYIDDVSLIPVDCGVASGQELELYARQIFPNPTAGTVWISALRLNARLTVLDLSGRVVLDERIAPPSLDISSLAEGVYLMRLKDDKGVHLTRVVLQK